MAIEIEPGNIALFVDADNMFHTGLDYNISDVLEVVGQYGGDIVKKVAYFGPYDQRKDRDGIQWRTLTAGIMKFMKHGFEIRSNTLDDCGISPQDLAYPADGLLIAECLETAIANVYSCRERKVESDLKYMALITSDGHFAGAASTIRKCNKKLIVVGTETRDRPRMDGRDLRGNNGGNYSNPHGMSHFLVRCADYCEIIEPKKGEGIDTSKYKVEDEFETSTGFKSFLVKFPVVV